MATTDMYRVVQVATGVAGGPFYITGYFDSQIGTAQQAADAWRALTGPTAGTFTTPLRYESIVSVDLVDPGNGDIQSVVPVSVGSLQFTSTVEKLPPTTTLLLRWRTGVYIGGREVRGRTNLSGFNEGQSDSGVPSSVILSEYLGKMNAMLSNVNVRHVVWSRKAGEHYQSTVPGVWNQWAVLRSRR